MYDELYGAWRVEVENPELSRLTSDFYTRAAAYLKRIKEESRLLEQKTVKSTLLEHELENAQRIVYELVWIRYRKLVKRIVEGQKVPMDLLATEEEKLCGGVMPSTEAYSNFAKSLLLVQVAKLEIPEEAPTVPVAVVASQRKRVTLRFIKQVPSIIGSDMKTYGPFQVEDVASVPAENARILIKQHLAESIEIP